MCLAVPGKVVSISGDNILSRMAQISFGSIEKQASLALLPDTEIGDYVLVHAGVAISKIDEEAALKTLTYLEEIGELLSDQEKDMA